MRQLKNLLFQGDDKKVKPTKKNQIVAWKQLVEKTTFFKVTDLDIPSMYRLLRTQDLDTFAVKRIARKIQAVSQLLQRLDTDEAKHVWDSILGLAEEFERKFNVRKGEFLYATFTIGLNEIERKPESVQMRQYFRTTQIKTKDPTEQECLAQLRRLSIRHVYPESAMHMLARSEKEYYPFTVPLLLIFALRWHKTCRVPKFTSYRHLAHALMLFGVSLRRRAPLLVGPRFAQMNAAQRSAAVRAVAQSFRQFERRPHWKRHRLFLTRAKALIDIAE